MKWFKAVDSISHRRKSLDSGGSTSYNLLPLALMHSTTCESKEIGTPVSDSSADSSSLSETESDQELSVLQFATPDIDSVYIDDMAARANLYNDEVGTPHTLFFHHARAMFQNKCLDPQRILRGYVEIDFLERDLYAMLG